MELLKIKTCDSQQLSGLLWVWVGGGECRMGLRIILVQLPVLPKTGGDGGKMMAALRKE